MLNQKPSSRTSLSNPNSHLGQLRKHQFGFWCPRNPVQHQRTKHIEIDIHFVREKVAMAQVKVLHVPSALQYADIFTKGLPSTLFNDFRYSLTVRSPDDVTEGGWKNILLDSRNSQLRLSYLIVREVVTTLRVYILCNWFNERQGKYNFYQFFVYDW